tara:strand:- start:127 stop:573 length:447 start_codon:yes stop_codon:yes gene_type:complete
VKSHIIDSNLTYSIRKKVLWPHIKNGDYSLPIDKNIDTFHLGVFLNEKIISIGTFIKENNSKFKSKKQYRLRAMATDQKYRKMGAGKNLFLKGISILKKREIDLLWCDARLIAIPFYKSLNMLSLNETYYIPNIGPHKTMYLYLNLNT